jgi:hypothetical protein
MFPDMANLLYKGSTNIYKNFTFLWYIIAYFKYNITKYNAIIKESFKVHQVINVRLIFLFFYVIIINLYSKIKKKEILGPKKLIWAIKEHLWIIKLLIALWQTDNIRRLLNFGGNFRLYIDEINYTIPEPYIPTLWNSANWL